MGNGDDPRVLIWHSKEAFESQGAAVLLSKTFSQFAFNSRAAGSLFLSFWLRMCLSSLAIESNCLLIRLNPYLYFPELGTTLFHFTPCVEFPARFFLQQDYLCKSQNAGSTNRA